VGRPHAMASLAVIYSKCRYVPRFYAADRWTKKQVHCIYQALIVAIATRHADAVDINSW